MIADFCDQRLDVPRLQVRVEQTAVEITVIADRGTERNVNVQTEHLVIWRIGDLVIW